MKTTNYGFTKSIDYEFDTALEKVTEALKQRGFGVLTIIDAQAKMKEKLGVDMERYMILGVCNPSAAHTALQSEVEIGLLMPCNVIVYEKEEITHVAAIRPTRVMSIIDNPEMKPLAEEIEGKLMDMIEKV